MTKCPTCRNIGPFHEQGCTSRAELDSLIEDIENQCIRDLLTDMEHRLEKLPSRFEGDHVDSFIRPSKAPVRASPSVTWIVEDKK